MRAPGERGIEPLTLKDCQRSVFRTCAELPLGHEAVRSTERSPGTRVDPREERRRDARAAVR